MTTETEAPAAPVERTGRAFSVTPTALTAAIAQLREVIPALDAAGHGEPITAATSQIDRIAAALETYLYRLVTFDTTVATDGIDAAMALAAEWNREGAAVAAANVAEDGTADTAEEVTP